jgi:hypothetical protein
VICSTKHNRRLLSVIKALALCLLCSSAFAQSHIPTNSEKLAVVNDAESALDRFDKVTRGIQFAKSSGSEQRVASAQEALKDARRFVSTMRELIAVRRISPVSNTLLFFAYASIQEVAARAGTLAAIASDMGDDSLASSLSRLKDNLARPRETAFSTVANQMNALDLDRINCERQP